MERARIYLVQSDLNLVAALGLLQGFWAPLVKLCDDTGQLVHLQPADTVCKASLLCPCRWGVPQSCLSSISLAYVGWQVIIPLL